jgi:hypothetical protein
MYFSCALAHDPVEFAPIYGLYKIDENQVKMKIRILDFTKQIR